ncbi:MAG: TonB family protein [Nitrospira sp.]|nr:TonB family protein [Nitrospira sp.]
MLDVEALRPGGNSGREGWISGWVCSCAFHGLAIIGALYGLRMPVSLPEAPFRWEVALHEAVPAPVEPPREFHKTAPASAARAAVSRQSVQRAQGVQTQSIVHQVAQPYEPAVQTREPIVRTVESQASASEIERPEAVHSVAVVARASDERMIVTTSSIVSREQATVVSRPAAVRPPVERPSVDSATVAASEPMESVNRQRIVAQASPVEERPVLHTETSHMMPEARAHYGWLKEALADKIERMKHYPDGAVERRWEGRVVVRGVITAAGELRDLVIAESSGFQVLDEAAMALLRRISPLALAHPLGQAQVAWRIPITYGVK